MPIHRKEKLIFHMCVGFLYKFKIMERIYWNFIANELWGRIGEKMENLFDMFNGELNGILVKYLEPMRNYF